MRLAIAVLGCSLALACQTTPASDPLRYRLASCGGDWSAAGGDAVLDDLRPRYPEYFAVVLGTDTQSELDLRPLRDDLERAPVDRRNYDALNAVAIGYFELNHRAEAQRGDGGMGFFWGSQRASKLLAVPWRGYAETDDAALRGAILDFFEDAGTGDKLSAAGTSGRVGPVVESLAKKEEDPERLARIEAIVQEISERQRALESERVYLEEGLTIGALADRLGTGEHVLRSVINRGMGHRNFNDFLHTWRIREACEELSRPEQARLPVLSIAMKVGYGSIGAFNRAFKARIGMTPTDFRRNTTTGASHAR